jgi:hypothetical protein
MRPADAFEGLRLAFERAEIRYAVGGSWASTAFGEPRFTNDVDIVAEVSEANLHGFLRNLPDTFYVDEEEVLHAMRDGRALNLIHIPTTLKFDLFPAAAFPLGAEELDRAVSLEDTGLSKGAVRFVTPEDILLAKLYWYKSRGDMSEVQWRDIKGVLRGSGGILDRRYLEQSAAKLGVSELLDRALRSG